MSEMALKVAQEVSKEGGTTYYVGGYVRDRLMGKPNKDVDIEVHGITPQTLESILDNLGERITIGESFGIYGLKGYDLDIAMPRKETNRGSGHRDFDICVDPFAGTMGAAKRRDFTINAMMENVLTGEVVDHFGGRQDLSDGVIRHVNDSTFAEDPLRVLRAAQFASRFEFKIAPETLALCEGMALDTLASERILGEMTKALLKAAKPSIFFEVLREMNQLKYWFPELEALIDVPQNPLYHGEGDVWIHTMMVIDEAAKLRDKAENPLGFMLSAVVHDLGKATCTEVVNGAIHAYEHEFKGVPLAKNFVQRISSETKLIDYVANMVRCHMNPNKYAELGVKVKTTNKMFDESVAPMDLILFSAADDLGRIITTRSFEEQAARRTKIDAFLRKRYEVYKEYMARPYVMGRDLIEAGLEPSEKFSEYLKYAHKMRLAGVSKKSALMQVLHYARKNG